MAVVLSTGSGADVRLSIIEAVIVYVIDDEAGRDFYYTAVHVDGWRLVLSSDPGVALCVEGVSVFGDVPGVLVEAVVVLWVDDCVFALCEGYAAERIAVAEAAIKKQY